MLESPESIRRYNFEPFNKNSHHVYALSLSGNIFDDASVSQRGSLSYPAVLHIFGAWWRASRGMWMLIMLHLIQKLFQGAIISLPQEESPYFCTTSFGTDLSSWYWHSKGLIAIPACFSLHVGMVEGVTCNLDVSYGWSP